MGHPPYDPKALLKLYLYGYLNTIRSSRRLERETKRNIELFYLMNWFHWQNEKTLAIQRIGVYNKQKTGELAIEPAERKLSTSTL